MPATPQPAAWPRVAAPSGAAHLATAPALVEWIDAYAEQLHEQIDRHRDFMLQLACASCGDPGAHPVCPLVACPRVAALREAIRETVVVLEATRHSFKSRQLVVIRKRLTDVLVTR